MCSQVCATQDILDEPFDPAPLLNTVQQLLQVKEQQDTLRRPPSGSQDQQDLPWNAYKEPPQIIVSDISPPDNRSLANANQLSDETEDCSARAALDENEPPAAASIKKVKRVRFRDDCFQYEELEDDKPLDDLCGNGDLSALQQHFIVEDSGADTSSADLDEISAMPSEAANSRHRNINSLIASFESMEDGCTATSAELICSVADEMEHSSRVITGSYSIRNLPVHGDFLLICDTSNGDENVCASNINIQSDTGKDALEIKLIQENRHQSKELTSSRSLVQISENLVRHGVLTENESLPEINVIYNVKSNQNVHLADPAEDDVTSSREDVIGPVSISSQVQSRYNSKKDSHFSHISHVADVNTTLDANDVSPSVDASDVSHAINVEDATVDASDASSEKTSCDWRRRVRELPRQSSSLDTSMSLGCSSLDVLMRGTGSLDQTMPDLVSSAARHRQLPTDVTQPSDKPDANSAHVLLPSSDEHSAEEDCFTLSIVFKPSGAINDSKSSGDDSPSIPGRNDQLLSNVLLVFFVISVALVYLFPLGD